MRQLSPHSRRQTSPVERPAAASDRSGDLHPVQHVRGDVPGRRDHARRAQLRRRPRDLQRLQRVHLALPDRRDRQLAQGAQRSRAYSLDEQLGWDTLPAQRARSSARPRPTPLPPDVARIAAGRDRRPGRRRARRRGRRRSRSCNLYTLAKPATATVSGNFRAHRRRRVDATSATSCSTSARTAFPVLEGQTIGIVPPGIDAQGRPHYVAPVLGREPARRRAAALQQRRADGEARAPRTTTARRSPASRRTTCATSRRATTVRRDRALTARAS